MSIVSRKRMGFSVKPLHKRKEQQAFQYLSQRMTFWIAVISLFAFVTGNMLGQHGWRVFWKSVLGGYDDSLIVYDGTVPPIAQIPDYSKWALYGGDAGQHTFEEVPRDLLIDFPRYDAAKLGSDTVSSLHLVFSIGYMGSYRTGKQGDGAHPAVDIRVPQGTPVVAVGNGVVTQVGDDRGGFGKFVVIKLPRVPDPDSPTKVTNLYAAYAHLSTVLVSEGTIVKKGEPIAASGQTGNASGPHLHFQIDRESAPWHPYWPFTSAEAKEANLTFDQAINAGLHSERGYAYTVNPLAYVQANFAPVTIVKAQSSSSSKSVSTVASRKQARLQKLALNVSSSSSATPLVVRTETVVTTLPPAPLSAPPPDAALTIDITHSGTFSPAREWKDITITLRDAQGNIVPSAQPPRDLYLRTAYGQAEFRPAVLTALDFKNGVAHAEMLPLGKTTIVIVIQPQGVMSEPMKYVP